MIKLMSAIIMIDHADRNPENKIDNVEYNIREHDGKKILVIPGVRDSSDTWDSFFFRKERHEFYSGKLKVHHGFYKQAEKLFEIAKEFDLFIGHSLGGAIAQILSLKLNKPSITFGAPRIGGLKVADAIKELHTRVNSKGDIITHLPPWFFGYIHGGRKIKVGIMERPWWKFWSLEDHTIDDYLKSVNEYSKIQS